MYTQTYIMKLPLIPQDKANHFIYGLLIFTMISTILNVVFGLGVCIVAAFTKELYDLQHKQTHTPDIYDFIWTVAGGIVGLIVSFLC